MMARTPIFIIAADVYLMACEIINIMNDYNFACTLKSNMQVSISQIEIVRIPLIESIVLAKQ